MGSGFDWAHIPENLSPVVFTVGSFEIRWYPLMYIIGFLIVYFLVLHRLKTEKFKYGKEIVSNFMIYGILGVLIGGRLGYVLFYDLAYYLSNPIEIISPFDFSNGIRLKGIAGMSYHGGVIGVLIAGILFCRRNRVDFWGFSELFVPAIPIAYTFGRIGNFINGELYGRVTDVPWGMYFPLDPTNQLRHPSQLYEALFEGVVLFIILWSLRKKRLFSGSSLAFYLIGYGLARFFIEFVREPDAHLGFIIGPFTMGQILCFFMVVAGLGIIKVRKPSKKSSK